MAWVKIADFVSAGADVCVSTFPALGLDGS